MGNTCSNNQSVKKEKEIKTPVKQNPIVSSKELLSVDDIKKSKSSLFIQKLYQKYLNRKGQKLKKAELDDHLKSIAIQYLSKNEFEIFIPISIIDKYYSLPLMIPEEIYISNKPRDDIFLTKPIMFNNGAIYYGQMTAKAICEGYGILILHNNQHVLEGLWNNGNIIHGREYFNDGSIYEGGFVNNEPSENGRFYYVDSKRYVYSPNMVALDKDYFDNVLNGGEINETKDIKKISDEQLKSYLGSYPELNNIVHYLRAENY
jgi:hypothetical protein